jgi:hypothetical protein
VVNATHRPLCPGEEDPVPILQKAGWIPGPARTGAENLAPTEIQSPDRLAVAWTLRWENILREI